ncbi:hypothetical protein C9I98_19405 [Photobacterium sanctipauli]|uniref:Uncharacterized protein n=1 Tax=Photobacterium sanctipauli TaxID=1342794 RepID=A0A2T3NN95_9GAMM|nr:hypothetical protein [Photobacterium sanctipauli]PSW17179.1 hypothetical protein C9I98_19405 [Photobacterium sanctipauli]
MARVENKLINDGISEAIKTIYTQFPNLSYKPRPDDVKLLAAYMKSQDESYPLHLDELLAEENLKIEMALKKYHSINKTKLKLVATA